ncbi:MAG: VCBS repeat-containing protein [Candidatus Sulfotelmatobacter sp.]
MKCLLSRSLVESVCRTFNLVVVVSCIAAAALAQNPVPQIVGPAKPSAVPPGSGAFTLTVYGANFVPGAIVNWNGQARFTTFVSANELQSQILATDVATNAAGLISVTNPPPGGGKSSASWAQVEVHDPITTITLTSSYEVPVPYNFTYSFLMADFNGDNNLDLFADSILMLGNGKGQFRFGSTIRNFVYYDGATYGDFNGDGELDLAYVSGAVNGNGNNGQQISIALGDGKGKFNVASQIKTFGLSGFWEPVVADFNGDGKLDLAVIQSKSFIVYLGNGDGTFQKFKQYALPGSVSAWQIVPGDFNSDGKLDLMILGQYGDIYLILGKGNGEFQVPAIPVSTGKQWICGVTNGPGVLLNDFNGDGKLDFLACTSGMIGVFLGNGDGSFHESDISVPPSGDFLVPVTGDFNSDGMPDLLVSEIGSGIADVLVFWGNGDGTFQAPQVVTLPTTGKGGGIGELGMAAGDLNSDGLLDFVDMTAFGDSAVYVQQRQ